MERFVEALSRYLITAGCRCLRISRFKHEGGDFTTLAQCIAKAALVSVNDLHRRHRGGLGSDARKCFS